MCAGRSMFSAIKGFCANIRDLCKQAKRLKKIIYIPEADRASLRSLFELAWQCDSMQMNMCVCLCALCVGVCMRMCACQNLTSNGRWMIGLFFFVAGDFDYFDSDRCAIESAESPLAHCSSKPSTSLESQSQNSMSVCPDTHRWGRPYRFNHFAALDKSAMLRSSNVNIFGEEAKNVERRTRKKKT